MKKIFALIVTLLLITQNAYAARLWSCGFELNSQVDGVEFAGGVQTFTTIDTGVTHGGTYSQKINSTGAGADTANSYIFNDSGSITGNYFVRIYFFLTTSASNNVTIFEIANKADASLLGIRINTNDTLSLYYIRSGNGRIDIGSASSALSKSAWHYIEINFDFTNYSTSVPISARIDGGSSFASGTVTDISTGKTSLALYFGNGCLWGDPKATGLWYFDDIAVNNSTGSFQNSWPGVGNIVHLHPGAAGDSTQWVPTSGTNWSNVDEVTPDDTTTKVTDVVLNESDLYTVVASGLASNVTVNVVSVGVRFNNDTADATTAFKVQIEKATGGTKTQSAAITPNSTTWKTNATASPYSYPITLYQDPNSSAWTQATLDTMQIGQQSSLIGVNKNQVSTIWALVDYTPSSSTTKTLAALGAG